MLRFYYNIANEAPYVGSVDHGRGTTEHKVRSIVCDVHCVSKFQVGMAPQFWMECGEDAELSIKDEIAYLRYRYIDD